MPRRISPPVSGVPNSGYLNDALAEPRRTSVHMYTYIRMRKVCINVCVINVCVINVSARTHAQNSFRLDRTSALFPSTHPSYIPVLSLFLSLPLPSLYSCPSVSVCGGITSRRNHGNHAAGAESVGMQALICRAIHKVISSSRDEGGEEYQPNEFSCARQVFRLSSSSLKQNGRRSLENIPVVIRNYISL